MCLSKAFNNNEISKGSHINISYSYSLPLELNLVLIHMQPSFGYNCIRKLQRPLDWATQAFQLSESQLDLGEN